jgi:hypothetical protein
MISSKHRGSLDFMFRIDLEAFVQRFSDKVRVYIVKCIFLLESDIVKGNGNPSPKSWLRILV